MPELIEYPPEPLPGEEDWQTWYRRACAPWRMEMKRKLLVRRGSVCERPGCNNPAHDLDEPVIPRCSMRGFSVLQRWAAFASANMELACARCNRESAHDRDGAWKRACAQFGTHAMKVWYAGIGLKAPRWDWIIE